MTQIAMRDVSERRTATATRSAAMARFRTTDAVFGGMTLGAAILVLCSWAG